MNITVEIQTENVETIEKVLDMMFAKAWNRLNKIYANKESMHLFTHHNAPFATMYVVNETSMEITDEMLERFHSIIATNYHDWIAGPMPSLRVVDSAPVDLIMFNVCITDTFDATACDDVADFVVKNAHDSLVPYLSPKYCYRKFTRVFDSIIDYFNPRARLLLIDAKRLLNDIDNFNLMMYLHDEEKVTIIQNALKKAIEDEVCKNNYLTYIDNLMNVLQKNGKYTDISILTSTTEVKMFFI